jgi:hypothetical protein
MPNPIFVGELKRDSDGNSYPEFLDSSQKLLNTYHKKIGNKKIKMGISGLTEKKLRSVEQNNYYWGVVLDILADHFGYIGPGEKEDLHNEMRSMFLVRIGKLGQPVVESTTRISTELFEKYLEAVRTWALQEHQCKIPMPNEVEEADESDTYRKL